jgi:hypothetical protein
MVKSASNSITLPTGIRNLLSEGIFISKDPNDRIRKLNDTFPMSIEADKIIAAAKKAKRALTIDEQALVNSVNALINELVQVDVFDKLGVEKHMGDDYVRPALRHTKFAHMKTAAATATA